MKEGVVGIGRGPAVLRLLFGSEVGLASKELGIEIRGDVRGQQEKNAIGHRDSFRASGRDGWADGRAAFLLLRQGLADAVERVGQGFGEDNFVEADLIEGRGLQDGRQAVDRGPDEEGVELALGFANRGARRGLEVLRGAVGRRGGPPPSSRVGPRGPGAGRRFDYSDGGVANLSTTIGPNRSKCRVFQL